VQVEIFLLLTMLMRVVSGRSRLTSLLGLTGVGHLMKDTLFYGEERVLTMRESLPLIIEYLLKQSFGGSPFVKSNT
jgi:hypothetical protein